MARASQGSDRRLEADERLRLNCLRETAPTTARSPPAARLSPCRAWSIRCASIEFSFRFGSTMMECDVSGAASLDAPEGRFGLAAVMIAECGVGGAAV